MKSYQNRKEDTLKVKELEIDAKKQLEEKRNDKIKGLLESRLIEIERAKRVVSDLEESYTELLEKDVVDISHDRHNVCR